MAPPDLYKQKYEKYTPAQLENIDEAVVQDVVLDFDYNLEYKTAGYFDAVVWNIYRLLTEHYYRKGLKGPKNWPQAHRHAVILAYNLDSTNVKDENGNDLGISILKYLLLSAKSKKFAKVKLTRNFDILFLDKSDKTVFEFNAVTLRKSQIKEASQHERKDSQESSAQLVAPEKEPALATIFSPLKQIKISEARREKNVSLLESMRRSGKPPHVIEEQFRKLDLCSSYAIGLLTQQYGKDALTEAGLISYGKITDAWDIKSNGLQSDGIEVKASTIDYLSEKNGKIKIGDRKGYIEQLGAFFDSADAGNYPSLITAFQTNTRYAEQIWKANESKPEELRSYNSHVLVCLGREPLKTARALWRGQLIYFITSQTGINPELQRYLKIKIHRKNGEEIIVNSNGEATLTKPDRAVIENIPISKVWLFKGDAIEWQDVLVTDFYKGKERVMGLAYYASQNTSILMENYTLKHAERKLPEQYDYQPVGFIQIEPGKPVMEQLMEKSKLSGSDFYYYLTALFDAGINLHRISGQDIIPLFDIQEIRRKIDAKGGPAKVRLALLKANIDAYNKESPDDMFVLIESGRTPWAHFEPLFAEYFQGVYALTEAEKSLIVLAVDASCQNINLTSAPPKFEAGDTLYLTRQRIFEIAKYVREKQAQAFGPADYVKIIKSGDSPYAFIRDCFNAEIREMGLKLTYSELDYIEIAYLLKALQACSGDIDLTLLGEGEKKRWAKFSEGSRLIFRKADLKKCIETIQKKRSKQEMAEAFHVMLPVPRSDKAEAITVPEKVRDAIHAVYPGNSLEETVIRNALYFIWANEKGRGGRRKAVKSAAKFFGYGKSVGEFQIRPTAADIEPCKKLLRRFGIEEPKNYDEWVDMVEDDLYVSVIVAGQRIAETLKIFTHVRHLLGEKDVDPFDKDFMIMVLTTFNRSISAIYRAVLQKWALDLSFAAEVESAVNPNELDALLTDKGKRDELRTNIITTFKHVAEKLITAGKIQFNGDLDKELNKIFVEKPFKEGTVEIILFANFIQSPLFKELQRWYQEETGEDLTFVFTEGERKWGQGVFSYGVRLFEAKPDQWDKSFKDLQGLKETVTAMKGDYTTAPFTPQPVKLEEPRKAIASKDIAEEKFLEKIGVLECCTKGGNILTVYASGVVLRGEPAGQKKVLLYFGTNLEILGAQKRGREIWLKVKVAAGERKGEEGYVAFEKDWYTNEKGPELTLELERRFALLEGRSKKPLPSDYSGVMKDYLRFIYNLNPDETPKSAKLMEESLPTAIEVQDPEAIERIKTIARCYGYTNQKFFGVLPKENGGPLTNLLGQKLYLIDTENNRILSFAISTGAPRHETPSGNYTASGSGFRSLDKFGAHQGTFRRKYGKHGVTHFQSGRASMTTGLIGIQLQGEIVKSAGRYFHGTNHEEKLGKKASGGCVRMSNLDMVYLAGLLNGETFSFQIVETPQDMDDAYKTGLALLKKDSSAKKV